jgi:hypothetical protein
VIFRDERVHGDVPAREGEGGGCGGARLEPPRSRSPGSGDVQPTARSASTRELRESAPHGPGGSRLPQRCRRCHPTRS